MPVAPDLRQQLETDIAARAEVTQRNMMGTTAYMVRGRMFAFWVADGLVTKMSDRTRREFLDKKQGISFQGPAGRGFGEWVHIDVASKDDVEHALVAVKDAYEYVRGAQKPAKSKARKKGRK